MELLHQVHHSTVTVRTPIVAVSFFVADYLISLTNEKNIKERPHAQVAVSDFFREKKSRNISLQSLSSRWLSSLWSLWRLNTTIGNNTHFEKLKRYLAYQRTNTSIFFFHRLNFLYFLVAHCIWRVTSGKTPLGILALWHN